MFWVISIRTDQIFLDYLKRECEENIKHFSGLGIVDENN